MPTHFFFRRLRLLVVPLLVALAAAACGDDGGGDGVGPAVVNIFPSPTAGQQDRDVVLRVTYDLPLAVGSGSVAATADGEALSGLRVSFTGDPTIINVNPPSGGLWPAGASIEVTVSGVTDAEGDVAEDAVVTFQTIDDERPTIVAFEPENRGLVSDTRALVALRLTFSEPMNTTAGTLTQVEPDIPWFDYDARTWSENDTVLVIPRLGDGVIPYETDYRINIGGFVDQAGNLTDPETQAYVFGTPEDNQPPRVLRATPEEGQTDVDPQLDAIVVRFDEQMSTTRTIGRLEADGENLGQINGSWDGPGREITFSLDDGMGGSLLLQNAEHRLVLSLLQDLRGNPPSADPYLGGDSSLDFTTGVDETDPTVVSVTGTLDVGGIPTAIDLTEPTSNVDYPILTAIEIRFSEAMDTTTPASFSIAPVDGGDAQALPHTWNEGGTRLTFDPTAVTLRSSTLYGIDLGGVQDASGNLLVEMSFGDDQVLEFTTRAPSGEDCTEPLTTRDASEVAGIYTWTFAEAAVSVANGGTDACDGDGAGADLVIEYEKTTPAPSADPTAGRYLRITTAATEAETNGYNLRVTRGACAPDDEAAEELHCVTGQMLTDMGMVATGRDEWLKELDVGAGTYYLWVADPDGVLAGGAVTIEEVAVATEGESCADPYDVDSSIYSPPSGGDDYAAWTVTSASGVDRTRTNRAAFDCDGEAPTNVGVDAVIEVEKENAASYLDVRVNFGAAETDPSLRVEILGACDREATESVAFCGEGAPEHVFQGGAFLPAGPVYVWLAANTPRADLPAAVVEIREVPITTGEGCQAANTIASAGSVDVSGADSTLSLDVPSCFPAGSAVEWWSYEAVNGLVSFAPNISSEVALVDRATGQVLSCDTSAGDYALGAVVDVGDTVCVAVPSDTRASSLTLEDATYAGVEGTRTELTTALPSGSGITQDGYIVVGDDDVYFGYLAGLPPAFFVFPKDDTGTGTTRDDGDGIDRDTAGRGAALVGDSLFTIGIETTGARLHRVFDGSSWSSTVWDDGDDSTGTLSGVFIRTLASDGSSLWVVEDAASGFDTFFYSRSAASAGAPTRSVANIDLYDATGLAVDDEYLYVVAALQAGDRYGVYRLARDRIDAVPDRLTPELGFRDGLPTGIVVDDTTDPDYLYVRSEDPPAVHVVQNPDGATPVYVGTIAAVSDTGGAMGYDAAGNALYLYESEGGVPTFVKLE